VAGCKAAAGSRCEAATITNAAAAAHAASRSWPDKTQWMSAMKDYEINVKVKNNWLLTAMRKKGCHTGADLWRLSGVTQAVINDYLNLNTSFLRKDGAWKPSIIKLSEALNCMPEELVPPQHIETPLDKNTAAFEATMDEVTDFIEHRREHNPLELVERDEKVRVINEAMMSRLSDKERFVIEHIYGLNGHDEIKEIEVAKMMCLCQKRIYQIHSKALLRLKGSIDSSASQVIFKKPKTNEEIEHNKNTRERAYKSLKVLEQFKPIGYP